MTSARPTNSFPSLKMNCSFAYDKIARLNAQIRQIEKMAAASEHAPKLFAEHIYENDRQIIKNIIKKRAEMIECTMRQCSTVAR